MSTDRGLELLGTTRPTDVATERRARSGHVFETLSGSDDPVLAYKAGLLAGRSPETREARALRGQIPGSPVALALLRIFEQDEKTLHHVYRKWQGPHWTLTCLALIDYPPGDEALRPLVRRVYDWLFSKHFLRATTDRDLPRSGRPRPPLCLDGRQRDLVLRPARAGGRTHSRRRSTG